MTEQSRERTWRERVPKPVRTAGWQAWARLKRQKPGLLMRFAGAIPDAEPVLSPGYELRTWLPGDDAQWLALMNASGAFGEWDAARLARENAGLVAEAQVFAVYGGSLVAATGVLERPLRGKPALEMAWVTRHPAHAGHGLGRAVFLRSLCEILRTRPGTLVYLYTDDHRLTAIAMYLDFGFVPELRSHRSYAGRWERVFVALARRGRLATRD
ncbi:MAG: GNAT family N-acetyltransferase [Dehalococcoidia bacterium]